MTKCYVKHWQSRRSHQIRFFESFIIITILLNCTWTHLVNLSINYQLWGQLYRINTIYLKVWKLWEREAKHKKLASVVLHQCTAQHYCLCLLAGVLGMSACAWFLQEAIHKSVFSELVKGIHHPNWNSNQIVPFWSRFVWSRIFMGHFYKRAINQMPTNVSVNINQATTVQSVKTSDHKIFLHLFGQEQQIPCLTLYRGSSKDFFYTWI